jgi:hypothetical protein
MNKVLRTGNKYIYFGGSWSNFGLGFNLSRYSFTLDLAFFWFGVEW